MISLDPLSDTATKDGLKASPYYCHIGQRTA